MIPVCFFFRETERYKRGIRGYLKLGTKEQSKIPLKNHMFCVWYRNLWTLGAQVVIQLAFQNAEKPLEVGGSYIINLLPHPSVFLHEKAAPDSRPNHVEYPAPV